MSPRKRPAQRDGGRASKRPADPATAGSPANVGTDAAFADAAPATRPSAGRCATSPRSGTSSAPTTPRSTSSARRRSTCSASTAGSATSPTSPTTTPGTARTRGCSPRRTSPTSSSRAARRSTTGCSRTPRCARLIAADAGRSAAQGRDGVLRRGDRADLRRARLRPDPARRPQLREHLDSKIVTTRLGNEAGAPSVPNVLTRVDDCDGARRRCRRRRASATTWSSRRRTATPARPPSSSAPRPTGTSTPTTSSARTSRS